MRPDSLLLLSDAQAFTATAASTNTIDLGTDKKIGAGEPMCVVFTVDTAADTASGNETYAFAVETEDNATHTSATTVISRTIAGSNLTAGSLHTLPLPPEVTFDRYLRMYNTLGGTTPSVTITAWLCPLNQVQNWATYPKNYTV